MFNTSDVMVMTAIAGGSGTAAAIDLFLRRVPNALTFGMALVGLTLAAAGVSGLSVASALAGLVVGLLLMLPGHVVAGTGAGDVKMLASLGTLLGPRGVVAAFFYAAIAGGVLAVVVAMRRRILGRTVERAAAFVATRGANVAEIEHHGSDNRFAYAPAIAVGAIAAALGW